MGITCHGGCININIFPFPACHFLDEDVDRGAFCPIMSVIPFGLWNEKMTGWPSRPEELHPQPLTEPDVSLSTYPARATQ
jgi:hypothetical protein